MIGSDHQRVGLAGELPHIAGVIADRLRRNGFDPAHAVNRQVLGLAEEAGEFVGAYRRWSGQARRTGTADEMHEELADVIITAFVTAHELGVDINAVLADKLHTIFTRGWRDRPAPSTETGSDTPRVLGKQSAGRVLDGQTWDQFPMREADVGMAGGSG